MKRLVIACVILLALLAVTLYSSHSLQTFSLQLNDLLTQAEAAAEEEDWSTAYTLTQQAYERWQSQNYYLHVTLHHSDTDNIYSSFQEVLEFIQRQEDGEYSAANAKLMAQISLLAEAEQLTLENVL